MRLRAIELEGFRSYREHERVDLAGLTLTAVIGGNHQGKSSLIASALEFALYARSPGASVVDAISRGQDRAVVSVEFDLGDGSYRVTRTRTRKGRHEVIVAVSDPEAENGWRSLEEKYSKNGADPFLIELLGMDNATARATWLIGQGDFGSFCEMDPAPRRKVLTSAFGLDLFEPLAEGADERRRAAQTALDKALYDRDSLVARIEGLDVDGPYPEVADEDLGTRAQAAEERAEAKAAEIASMDAPALKEKADQAQAALGDFDAAHRSLVARYQQDVARIERDLTEARNMLTQATQAREAAEEAQFEVSDCEDAVARAQEAVTAAEAEQAKATERVEEIRAEQSRLTSEKSALKARGDAANARVAELTERIEALRASAQRASGSCFTCGQDLSVEQTTTLITEQEALVVTENETLTALRQEYRSLDAAISQAYARIQEEQRGGQAQALSQARQTLSAAEQALTRTTEQAKGLDLWTERETITQERITGLESDLLDLGDEPQPDGKKRSGLVKARDAAQQALEQATGDGTAKAALMAERDALRAEVKALWSEQVRREGVAKEKKTLAEPLTKADKAVTEHQAAVEGYATLTAAFRPTGIPAMILAGVIEELNEEANDILGTMGSDLGVLVTASKETQRGTAQDKVMIYALTPDGPVDYATLSGQEKYFIALSLRMGLAECVARRTGTPIETIVQDEGWGALDGEARAAVMDALERMSQRFSIFSVTHITEVKDAFETVIEVSAASGTSRAEVLTR